MQEYGVSNLNVCKRCGQPTNSLALVCMTCVGREYLAEEMARSRAQLAAHPNVKLELAREQNYALHAALLSNPWFSWCGARLKQARSKRGTHPVDRLPPGVCRVCLEVLGKETGKW